MTWRRWVVCGGKHKLMTSWDRGSFMRSIFCKWVLFPSNSNRTGRSTVASLNSINFLNHSRNNFAVIHPWSLQTLQAPGAAFNISCGSILFLGNTIMGGIYWSLALKHFDCDGRTSFCRTYGPNLLSTFFSYYFWLRLGYNGNLCFVTI